MNKEVLVKVTGAAMMSSSISCFMKDRTPKVLEDMSFKTETEAFIAGGIVESINILVPVAITALTYVLTNRKK